MSQHPQNSTDIKSYFTNLNVSEKVSFSNIPRSDSQSLSHGYHRYPAKFIPALANYLIKKNTREGDIVCDPFGGCGTTLVESIRLGRSSVGIDINPIARLISKTKITPIDPTKLEYEVKILLGEIHRSKIKIINPPDGRLSYWFNKESYSKLILLFRLIQETKESNIRRFYECAFSNILKNCSKWLMKSIKPTVDRSKKYVDPFLVFEKQIKYMVKKNKELYDVKKTANARVTTKFFLRDARNTLLSNRSVDYILTSPPYVTSYEYADLHQLSLIWFENISNWLNFKKKFVGTSHRTGKNKYLESEIAENIISSMVTKDKSLSKRIRAYFEDMNDFISESKRILKKKGKISVVLGNTTLKEIAILNAEVAYEQMLNRGFKNITVEKRQTSSQSITPYRDGVTGRFTGINNTNSRKAYSHEFIITGIN